MSEFYPAPVRRADEVKFCPFDLKQVDMEGTFEGYASLFNRQDMGRCVVLPGAFRSSIAKGREVLSLMRAGALDGLSIGFRAEEGARDRRTGVRRLKAIDLWEISIVTFPMLPEARVSKVKVSAAPRRLPTEREFERWLTQDAGFTRSQARAVMRSGLKGLDPMRDAGESPAMQQVLATRFAEAARLIRTSNGRSSL